MDRRTYLQSVLGIGGALLVPAGVMALVGRTGGSPAIADTPDSLAHVGGATMGTHYNIRFAGTVTSTVEQAIANALADTDARMSTYRPGSELSRLNKTTPGEWYAVSDESFGVIDVAYRTRQSSTGAFDPSVGGLVNLWGFGPGGSIATAPSTQAISARLDGIGAFDIDPANRRVRRLHASTELDLSGIAKGHGVDRVAAVLDDAGVGSYLVEVGGELYARGRKPDSSPWRVAIERPDSRHRDVYRIVELNDSAIATSGDYRNFFIDGGQRYSHTIDPHTGRPAEHELASVSVIADSTLEADALSTAMMVMGPAEADTFARRHALAVHFILKSGNKLSEQWTPAFEPYIAG